MVKSRMLLKTKIVTGFVVSAVIVLALAALAYVGFVSTSREIAFLEVTDSVRSKTLQLRRHEKNFFLYRDRAEEELKSVEDYIEQLRSLTPTLGGNVGPAKDAISGRVEEYAEVFNSIRSRIARVQKEFDSLKPHHKSISAALPLIEGGFYDNPLRDAAYLKQTLSLPDAHPLIADLILLDRDINRLRKVGEAMIADSKDLDRLARERADWGIRISKGAILIVFPFFLLIGFGALVYVSTDVVKRLNLLIDRVEETSSHYDPGVPLEDLQAAHEDEVGVLLARFERMRGKIAHWEEKIEEKNAELLKSKKLTVIGTLAAGVAHELNNPLNNIHLSAQALKKELGPGASPFAREIVEDITGQTVRVKAIVGDLLAFARERELKNEPLAVAPLMRKAYELIAASRDITNITYVQDVVPGGLKIMADAGQIERVFVNLFTNAVDAMDGKGTLTAKACPLDDATVVIWVSDTGKGIGPEELERVFDPFFTTKDKGTGLGLAIVMNMVRRHGGEITVVSERGEGTAFELLMPRANKEA